MLDLAIIPILAVHLLAMNVATAGPLVCVWLKRREVRYDDAEAGRVGEFLAWQSVGSLLVGMVLGLLAVAVLWMSGRSAFFTALSAVPPRRLWFGVVELAFFLALMIWYARAWPRVRRPSPWHLAVALLAATDLIYHFPPLFAALAVLQGRATPPAAELSYREFLTLLLAPETVARLLHFLLASVAVTGSLIVLHALRSARSSPLSDRWLVLGARLALAPSLLQMIAGVYLLLNLPHDQQERLMGGNALVTGLFAVSGIAALALLHSLGGLAMGDASRREAVRSLWLMGLVVVAMTAARHLA